MGRMPMITRWMRIIWKTVRYGYPDQLRITGIWMMHVMTASARSTR